MNALGMIELTSIPAGVQAGDAMLKAAAVELVTAQPVCAGKYIVLVTGEAAMKAADVRLMEGRLGRGLGGKSFIALTGEIASVQAAIDAARAVEGTAGLMNDSVVIPAPHPDMIRSLY